MLALGRRRRRPSSAIRRAARERDHGRCRFPGCESRRTDLHHIQHWVNGGRTDLDNLISLCPWHHKVVHDRGYTIAAPPGGAFTFYRPDGTPLPSCPPLPEPDGRIGAGPRRGHHPGHDHPALVRRAPRPEPRHLGLLRQRPHRRGKTSRLGAGPGASSSGRTHGAATSATRSTTSAAITRNTRPPDSPALYACFAIFRLLRTELNEANEETQLGAGCTGGGCIHRDHDRAGHAGPGGLVRQ